MIYATLMDMMMNNFSSRQKEPEAEDVQKIWDVYLATPAPFQQAVPSPEARSLTHSWSARPP